jgi:hypothetical protein
MNIFSCFILFSARYHRNFISDSCDSASFETFFTRQNIIRRSRSCNDYRACNSTQGSRVKPGWEWLIFKGHKIHSTATFREILGHVKDPLRYDKYWLAKFSDHFSNSLPRFAVICLCSNQSRELWWVNRYWVGQMGNTTDQTWSQLHGTLWTISLRNSNLYHNMIN